MEDHELSQAIIAFLGGGKSAFPKHDDEAVMASAKGSDPSDLVRRVREITGECLGVPVDWSTHNLTQGGDVAREAMALLHPELTAGALDELRWMFTYNWR